MICEVCNKNIVDSGNFNTCADCFDIMVNVELPEYIPGEQIYRDCLQVAKNLIKENKGK